MATRRKPSKPGRSVRGPKKRRIRLAPMLTREELEWLQASAKADLRSVANFVELLIEAELKRRVRPVTRPPW